MSLAKRGQEKKTKNKSTNNCSQKQLHSKNKRSLCLFLSCTLAATALLSFTLPFFSLSLRQFSVQRIHTHTHILTLAPRHFCLLLSLTKQLTHFKILLENPRNESTCPKMGKFYIDFPFRLEQLISRLNEPIIV